MPPSATSREAILLLALASFIAGVSLRCVEPMLPELAADFGTSVSAASSIITAFALAYAAALLVQGPLGDRYGKLRVSTVAMAAAGAASIGCAAAWDLASLAALRLAAGAFGSASVVLGMSYIGEVVPLAERQATIARFIAGSILGQTLGPFVGGAFTDWLGWRASFAAIGAGFLLVSLVLGARTAASWGGVTHQRLELAAAYARLLRRAPVRWVAGCAIAETFFYFGAFSFLGAFLKLRFDLSYTLIGVLLAGYGLGGLAYSALVDRLIRGLGERGLVAAGGVLGLALFAALAVAPHWTLAIPCTIGLGLAFYMTHNTVQTKATEVAPDARGTAVSLYASGWALGQALGVAAMGLAVAAFGYAPMIAIFGLGFGVFGLWLRANLWRLRP